MRFLTSILFFSCIFYAKCQTLEEVRLSFHQAVLDPDKSRDFHDYITRFKSENATIKAYQAVSEAMLAQVLWNPFTKLSQVRKYDKQIAMVVGKDPDNIEIRFLRFAIEYNLPRFLGMSDHLEEDKLKILANMKDVSEYSIDDSFWHYILYFMKDTSLCDETQIAQIEQRLQELGD